MHKWTRYIWWPINSKIQASPTIYWDLVDILNLSLISDKSKHLPWMHFIIHPSFRVILRCSCFLRDTQVFLSYSVSFIFSQRNKKVTRSFWSLIKYFYVRTKNSGIRPLKNSAPYTFILKYLLTFLQRENSNHIKSTATITKWESRYLQNMRLYLYKYKKIADFHYEHMNLWAIRNMVQMASQ